MKTLGVIGGRGYVGRELLDLIGQHPGFELALNASARDGVTPESAAAPRLDAYVLALPNGVSPPYVEAIVAARPDAVIVDVSADHRFDDAWVYGQPERLRKKIVGERLIANPGCYATAMQLALAPLLPYLTGPAHVFGVSGYSGAGTSPSPKNDPEVLRDNLYPYSLTGHTHEAEVTRTLGTQVFFAPHVAPFFRGVTVTVSVTFADPQQHGALLGKYEAMFGNEPLVTLSKEAPLVRDIAGRHHVAIGGLSVSTDGRHAVIVATIDNLLGGAATQAVRNLNLTLGFPELLGILDIDASSH